MSLTGAGEVAGLVKEVFDRFFPPDMSATDRANIEMAMTSEIENRDTAKAGIIAAEMKQDDLYTKRARPTVVYAGLAMIAINYVIFPMVARVALFAKEIPETGLPPEFYAILQPLNLPSEFWVAWGGIVGTWVLGRSAEKRGNASKLVSLITGMKK